MASLRELAGRSRRAAIEAVDSRLHWPSRPGQLVFEITAACDARCIHCPRHEMDRPKRPMAMALFRRMIDQAAEMRIPELVPNGYGEILTIPRVDEYLAYIRSRPHRFRLQLNTNGYNFNEDKIAHLFNYGVDALNVTIDGATPETAQAIRVGLKTERIERNIHRILEVRRARGLRRPRIRVSMVALPQNVHEARLFLDKWTGVADMVSIGKMSTRAGSITLAEADGTSSRHVRACVRPFRELNIWADGKAVLCCEDWNEEFVVGDLNEQTLQEIWQGERLAEVRRAHAGGAGGSVALCRACNQWVEPGRFVKLST